MEKLKALFPFFLRFVGSLLVALFLIFGLLFIVTSGEVPDLFFELRFALAIFSSVLVGIVLVEVFRG